MARNYIRRFVSGLKQIMLCCTNIYMPHIVMNECGMHLCRGLTDLCMQSYEAPDNMVDGQGLWFPVLGLRGDR